MTLVVDLSTSQVMRQGLANPHIRAAESTLKSRLAEDVDSFLNASDRLFEAIWWLRETASLLLDEMRRRAVAAALHGDKIGRDRATHHHDLELRWVCRAGLWAPFGEAATLLMTFGRLMNVDRLRPWLDPRGFTFASGHRAGSDVLPTGLEGQPCCAGSQPAAGSRARGPEPYGRRSAPRAEPLRDRCWHSRRGDHRGDGQARVDRHLRPEFCRHDSDRHPGRADGSWPAGAGIFRHRVRLQQGVAGDGRAGRESRCRPMEGTMEGTARS